MHGKEQIEAAERAQRERMLRLNHYNQGRKDQETIKRLSQAVKRSKGGNAKPNVAQQPNNSVVPDVSYTFRSLDPSMFR